MIRWGRASEQKLRRIRSRDSERHRLGHTVSARRIVVNAGWAIDRVLGPLSECGSVGQHSRARSRIVERDARAFDPVADHTVARVDRHLSPPTPLTPALLSRATPSSPLPAPASAAATSGRTRRCSPATRRRREGLVKLLLDCPVKRWFQPIDRTETTRDIAARQPFPYQPAVKRVDPDYLDSNDRVRQKFVQCLSVVPPNEPRASTPRRSSGGRRAMMTSAR